MAQDRGSQELLINNRVVRIKEPESGTPPKVIIMLLHGWTGDETVMWVFSAGFPKDHMIVAPRGIYPAQSNGFSWSKKDNSLFPSVNEFYPSIDTLRQIIETLQNETPEAERVILVGFSEGAALAYSYAITNPGSITKIAGLSGFVPGGVQPYFSIRPLQNVRILVAHGTKDKLIPIEQAHEDVEKLAMLGAEIEYCESDVGHKLGKECFKSLDKFIVDAAV